MGNSQSANGGAEYSEYGTVPEPYIVCNPMDNATIRQLVSAVYHGYVSQVIEFLEAGVPGDIPCKTIPTRHSALHQAVYCNSPTNYVMATHLLAYGADPKRRYPGITDVNGDELEPASWAIRENPKLCEFMENERSLYRQIKKCFVRDTAKGPLTCLRVVALKRERRASVTSTSVQGPRTLTLVRMAYNRHILKWLTRATEFDSVKYQDAEEEIEDSPEIYSELWWKLSDNPGDLAPAGTSREKLDALVRLARREKVVVSSYLL
jgi:hypothetical protein